MKKMKTFFIKNKENIVTEIMNPIHDWVATNSNAFIKRDGTSCMIQNAKLYKRFDCKLLTLKSNSGRTQLNRLNNFSNYIHAGVTVKSITNRLFPDGEQFDTVLNVNLRDNLCELKNNNIAVHIRDLQPINVILPKEFYKSLPNGAIPCQSPDSITGHWPHWIECFRNDNSNKWHFEAFDALADVDKINGTYELCGPKVQANAEHHTKHILINHKSEPIEVTDLSYNGLKKMLSNTTLDIEGIVFHHKTINDLKCKIRKSDFNVER